MKHIYLSILLLSAVTTMAQAPLVQSGMVREQNSGKHPIPDAQIIFSSAVPATSEQSGKFRLAFSGKKAGDWVFMTEITKKGYELVNDKELEKIKLGSSEQLGTDVILAKAGVIDAAKKEYYAISDKALKAGFEKEKAKLKTALQDAQATQSQYQAQYEASQQQNAGSEAEKAKLKETLEKAQSNLEQLEKQYDGIEQQYENQKKELDALSEKFARVNFDDVTPLYKEALELFKAGKVKEAIQKLESADLNKQVKDIREEQAKIIGLEKELAVRKDSLAKKKTQTISAIELLKNMYVSQFEIEKAEISCNQLLLLDSTDLDILRAVADFYKENHRYEKAMYLYPKIIAHPQAEAWQKANAYSFMGDLHTTTGDLDKALAAYIQCQDAYKTLNKQHNSSSYYKNNLAISYARLGGTHFALGNLDKALTFYKEGIKLSKELYAAYPKNVSFKNGLALSYQDLGMTYGALRKLNKALHFYEDYNKLEKELCSVYPNNVEFKELLAISCEKLGDTYRAIWNLEKALTFYEESNRLEKELYDVYPDKIEFKHGLAISYWFIGITHSLLGNLDKALDFYEECTHLEKELYTAYPNNVEFKNSLAASYVKIGEIYLKKENISKVKEYWKESEKHYSELNKISPQNVQFKCCLDAIRRKLKDLEK